MAAISCFTSYMRWVEGIRPTVRLWPTVPDVTVSTLPSNDRIRALMRGIACAAAVWAKSPDASAASRTALIRMGPFTPRTVQGKFHRAKTAKLGRNLDRHAWLDLRWVDHQRTLHAGDIALRRHRLCHESLEGLKISGDAFQDEIHFTRQHVALAHFRPTAHPLLEMLEIGVLLAGEADKDEAGDGIAQRLAVQIGMIAFDIAGLLQSPHPAQTGRRGDLGAAGQFHIGDAAIRLQLLEDAQINGVELAILQRTPS